MLKRFNRYPLIIDPSGQATTFICNEYKDRKITKTRYVFSHEPFKNTEMSPLPLQEQQKHSKERGWARQISVLNYQFSSVTLNEHGTLKARESAFLLFLEFSLGSLKVGHYANNKNLLLMLHFKVVITMKMKVFINLIYRGLSLSL